MNYKHLIALTTDHGVFEHCAGRNPRLEHGYCVDDVARALMVAERGLSDDHGLEQVAEMSSRFLSNALNDEGLMCNRRDVSGEWRGPFASGDHWGRSLWAWGTTMAESGDPARRAAAERGWDRAARQRSPFLRSMAHAVLGAGEVLRVAPRDPLALALLCDFSAMVSPSGHPAWPWPEPRLTYANAIVPHALLISGCHLGDDELVDRSLRMLTWLVQVQSRGEHLSLIPNTGWSPGQILPDFDQQGIEVAHLIEAVVFAEEIAPQPMWKDVLTSGVAWFLGDNDTGIAMADPRDGAGFDGLTWTGRNPNAGAESTLAYLSVMQRARQYLS